MKPLLHDVTDMNVVIENLRRASDNKFNIPSILDEMLYQEIEDYRSIKGNSYAKLSEELNIFVRQQFRDCWNLVDEGRVTADDLEKQIRNQVPSDKYIRDYVNGRPICFRYTNTIANFFGVNYSVSNFDPAKDFKYIKIKE